MEHFPGYGIVESQRCIKTGLPQVLGCVGNLDSVMGDLLKIAGTDLIGVEMLLPAILAWWC